jgi:hypothetical protein
MHSPKDFKDIGLNADWNCSAYHIGSNVYVLDNEDGRASHDDEVESVPSTYDVVRRFSDGDTDEIKVLAYGLSFTDAVNFARKELF